MRLENVHMISGTDFVTLSPEVIQAQSVLEVPMDCDIREVITLLCNPLLGTSDPGMLCGQCATDYQTCTGHFGHMHISEPVPNIIYISRIVQILNMICIHCHRIRVSEEWLYTKNKQWEEPMLNSTAQMHRKQEHFRTLATTLSKLSICAHPDCQRILPFILDCDGMVRGVYRFKDRSQLEESVCLPLSPRILYDAMRAVPADQYALLGIDAHQSHPAYMWWTVVPIIPLTLRPTRCHSGSRNFRGEDSITKKLRSIWCTNRDLLLEKKALDMEAHVLRREYSPPTPRADAERKLLRMQELVAVPKERKKLSCKISLVRAMCAGLEELHFSWEEQAPVYGKICREVDWTSLWGEWIDNLLYLITDGGEGKPLFDEDPWLESQQDRTLQVKATIFLLYHFHGGTMYLPGGTIDLGKYLATDIMFDTKHDLLQAVRRGEELRVSKYLTSVACYEQYVSPMDTYTSLCFSIHTYINHRYLHATRAHDVAYCGPRGVPLHTKGIIYPSRSIAYTWDTHPWRSAYSWRQTTKRLVEGFIFRRGRFTNGKSQLGVKLRNKGLASSMIGRLNGMGKSKFGRLRGQSRGRRTDFSARAVVSPAPFLRTDQVAVPESMARILTVPIRVAPYNIAWLRKLVENQKQGKYPGATSITCKRSATTVFISPRKSTPLRFGDVVHRHLVDGDIVPLNRQPTLSKYSIMGHRVVVHKECTFGLAVRAMPPYNGDCDGDEFNINVPQTIEARSELQEILGIRHNMIRNGRIVVGFHQHVPQTIYYLTHPQLRDTPIDRSLYAPWCTLQQLDVLERCSSTTLLQLFECTLPAELHIFHEGRLFVSEGRLHYPKALTKDLLNQVLLWNIHERFGSERAILYLDETSILMHQISVWTGCSFSFHSIAHDYTATSANKCRLEAALMTQIGSAPSLKRTRTVSMLCDKFRDLVGGDALDRISTRTTHCIKRRRLAGGTTFQLDPMLCILRSGSKGKVTNIYQNMAALGMQYPEDEERLEPTLHIHPNHAFNANASESKGRTRAQRQGLVTTSFFEGLSPLDVFNHARPGKQGLEATAVSTRVTGEISKSFGTRLENLSAGHAGLIQRTDRHVSTWIYGGHGLSRDHLIHVDWPSDEEIAEAIAVRTTSELQRFLYAATDFRRPVETAWRRLASPLDILCWIRERNTRPGHTEWNEHFAHELCREARKGTAAWWKDVPAHALYLEYWLHPQTLHALHGLGLADVAALCVEWKRAFEKIALQPGTPVGLLAAQNLSSPWTQLSLNRFHFAGSGSRLSSGVPRLIEIVTKTTRDNKTPNMRLVLTVACTSRLEATRLGTLIVGAESPYCYRNARLYTRDGDSVVQFVLDTHYMQTHWISPFALWRAARGVAEGLLPSTDLRARVTDIVHSPGDEWCIELCLEDADWTQLEAILGTEARERWLTAEHFGYRIFVESRITLHGLSSVDDFYVEPIQVHEGHAGDAERWSIVCSGSDLAGVAEMVYMAELRASLSSPFYTDHYFRLIDLSLCSSSVVAEVVDVSGVDAGRACVAEELIRLLSQNRIHFEAADVYATADALFTQGIFTGATCNGMVLDNSSIWKVATFRNSIAKLTQGCVFGIRDSGGSPAEQAILNTKLSYGTDRVRVQEDLYHS